jgi:hypothetical protein
MAMGQGPMVKFFAGFTRCLFQVAIFRPRKMAYRPRRPARQGKSVKQFKKHQKSAGSGTFFLGLSMTLYPIGGATS